MRPLAEEAGIVLTHELHSRLPLVIADAMTVKQILFNLLTNAIKFSTPGGTVEVFARTLPSGEIAFGVRDQGVGIPEHEQAHVFERFGQVRGQAASLDDAFMHLVGADDVGEGGLEWLGSSPA